MVVMGASAGGVSAISQILAGLPANFPLSVAVVLHRARGSTGVLSQIFQRRTVLAVKEAEDGEPLRPGVVHLATVDRHLTITGTFLHLTDTTKVRYVRPSADVLFESAAAALGSKVIAVVLTGGGSDESDGIKAVKAKGGLVIAQDQASSHDPDMPSAAIATGVVDFVLPLEEIAPKLVALTMGP